VDQEEFELARTYVVWILEDLYADRLTVEAQLLAQGRLAPATVPEDDSESSEGATQESSGFDLTPHPAAWAPSPVGPRGFRGRPPSPSPDLLVALEDSNLRPQPCESVLGTFAHLGISRKVQLRLQMTCPLVTIKTRYFPLDRARSAHAGPSTATSSGSLTECALMACYHDGMAKKTTTVRMPEELADTVEVVARGRGISVNALVVEALIAEVEKVRQDDHFMATLRKVTERDKEILDRLAQ
jgi:hypothetical protein